MYVEVEVGQVSVATRRLNKLITSETQRMSSTGQTNNDVARSFLLDKKDPLCDYWIQSSTGLILINTRYHYGF